MVAGLRAPDTPHFSPPTPDPESVMLPGIRRYGHADRDALIDFALRAYASEPARASEAYFQWQFGDSTKNDGSPLCLSLATADGRVVVAIGGEGVWLKGNGTCLDGRWLMAFRGDPE